WGPDPWALPGGARAAPARSRVEPVESRLQRLLNRSRHGKLELAVPLREGAALDEVGKRLFQEERIAARALGDHRGERVRQLRAGRSGRELPARSVVERVELDLLEPMRHPSASLVHQVPGAVITLAAVQEQQYDRLLVHDLDEVGEQVERRLVRPVEILRDDADRLLLRERGDDTRDAVDGLLLDAVARHVVELLG